MIENVDYYLVPAEDDKWQVRFLTGDFVETVIEYGAISINGQKEEMNFSFKVISSPIEDLSPLNVDLQDHSASVLLSIIESAVNNNEDIIFTERKDE